MPSKTPEQLAAIRAKVLADPNTKKIADSVQMSLEDYVEQVMKYVANPKMEPMVHIVPDNELREAGIEPVDVNKVKAYLEEYVDAQEISMKSKFADPNSQREKVSGKIPVAPPATAKPEEVRGDLKADLERERTSGKFKKF
jgi:hypothetical protein